MKKYLSLTLAILNTLMFGLYFIQPSAVETYQWVVTPFFAVFFISRYLEERKEK